MKKIILIILMFISVNVFSQTLTTYYSFKTYPTSINKNIYWYGVNFSRIDSVLHLLATGSTSFDLTAFHSFSGINNFTNGTTFSDSVRMTRLSVDTLTITSGKIDSARIPSTVKIDTAKFAHTDTLTTESVRSVWTFWNIVRCIGVVTFDVSPVFNAAVNFANGINVTGNATVSGDLVLSGWTKNQSSLNRDQYEKVKIVRTTMPAVTLTNSVAHGIPNWHTITSYSVSIFDDSTFNMISQPQNSYSTTNTLINTWYVDSLYINIKTPAGATTIAGDSVKFRITYTDYDR